MSTAAPKGILKTPAARAQQREATRLRYLAAATGEINIKLLVVGAEASGKSSVIDGLATAVTGVVAPPRGGNNSDNVVQTSSFVAGSVDSRAIVLNCFEVSFESYFAASAKAPSRHLDLILSDAHAVVICVDSKASNSSADLMARYSQGNLRPSDIDAMTAPLKPVDGVLSLLKKRIPAHARGPLAYLFLHKADSIAHLATSQLNLLKTLGSPQAMASLTKPALNMLQQQQQQLLASLSEPAPLLACGLTADELSSYASSAGIRRWYWTSISEGSTAPSTGAGLLSARSDSTTSSTYSGALSREVSAAHQPSTASRMTAALLGGVGGLLSSTGLTSSSSSAASTAAAAGTLNAAGAVPPLPLSSSGNAGASTNVVVVRPSSSLSRFLADLVDDCLRSWPGLLAGSSAEEGSVSQSVLPYLAPGSEGLFGRPTESGSGTAAFNF